MALCEVGLPVAVAMPSEDEQYAAYRSVAEKLGGRPLILRTLDVGADKPLPYLPLEAEANPFLGVRGIRLALEQPELLSEVRQEADRVMAEDPALARHPQLKDAVARRLEIVSIS